MTIKNRKKNPIKPDEVAGKFPAGTKLIPLQHEKNIFLISAVEIGNNSQSCEAWWVDYTNHTPPEQHRPFALESY